jgi:hypothetical protein
MSPQTLTGSSAQPPERPSPSAAAQSRRTPRAGGTPTAPQAPGRGRPSPSQCKRLHLKKLGERSVSLQCIPPPGVLSRAQKTRPGRRSALRDSPDAARPAQPGGLPSGRGVLARVSESSPAWCCASSARPRALSLLRDVDAGLKAQLRVQSEAPKRTSHSFGGVVSESSPIPARRGGRPAFDSKR